MAHIHRYIRAIGRLTKDNKDSGYIGYYKCAEPSCTHYMKAELILGKVSICNRCGDEFVLPLALRNLTNRPHCKRCTKKPTKTKEIPDVMEDYIELHEMLNKRS
jgi:hypothetical protein